MKANLNESGKDAKVQKQTEQLSQKKRNPRDNEGLEALILASENYAKDDIMINELEMGKIRKDHQSLEEKKEVRQPITPCFAPLISDTKIDPINTPSPHKNNLCKVTSCPPKLSSFDYRPLYPSPFGRSSSISTHQSISWSPPLNKASSYPDPYNFPPSIFRNMHHYASSPPPMVPKCNYLMPRLNQTINDNLNIPGQFPNKVPSNEQKRLLSEDEKEEDKKEEEDSLAFSDDDSNKASFSSSNAYKRRNVYKSIIRHMLSYIRKNRDDILNILKKNGYEMPKIEHAFFKISYYNDQEKQKGNPKRSQATIKKIVGKKRIYTYILRETLNAMIYNWNQGKSGKISSENLTVYREVCDKYYEATVKILGHAAEGTTYFL